MYMENILNSKIVRLILVLVFLFLLISFGVNKYMKLKTDLRISEQNSAALADSVRVSKNKLGELVYSKKILVAKNKKGLKTLNERLFKTLNNLDKSNGKINELSEIIAKFKSGPYDIGDISVIYLPDNIRGFQWNYEKVYDSINSRYLNGITKFKLDTLTNTLTPLKTTITRDELNFRVIQGIRTRDDGKVEMFATSDYPGFTVKELNSAIIDPSSHPALTKFTKPKRFKLGVYGGYGATLNLSTSTLIVGPQIGGGATYSLW